ncbi:L,D-transpeptidase family protein [Microbacterium halotolerans]|uniref:L,D-transpeptidase family protein n=1 Tax=Microbacterium halotolerans TaxID=246613 RepID=UPI000E6A9A87|nr:L,D-transpeptidase family protein [Microbacterium halotolerans]
MTDGGTAPIESVEVTDVTEDKPRRKRRTGLWLGIGIPGGLLVAGAFAASLVLIAPGVAVAGAPVGFHTAGTAAQAIEQRVDDATISIDGVEVTGEDLGAQVDAEEAAARAFEDHPLWKISDWNPQDPYAPTVTIDSDTAIENLKEKAPGLFVEPVDAEVEFSDGSFVAVAAEPGSGPDLDALAADLSTALVAGDGGITVSADSVEVPATTSTDAAKTQAAALNEMAENAGFYVEDERAVPVSMKQLGSWLDVAPDGEGGFAIAADTARIQKVVDALPEKIDREAQNVTQIVDTAGTVLDGGEGQDGWKVNSIDGVAAKYAKNLESGEGSLTLDVDTVEAEITTLERRLEVDLGKLQAYAIENDKVVKTFPVSPGKAGSETDQGTFKTYVKLTSQNMGNEDTTEPPYYYTPNVPYVMYFNGSEGFHGTYWHNEFGVRPMSHGCLNMSVADSKWLFDWTPVGTDVWVHA